MEIQGRFRIALASVLAIIVVATVVLIATGNGALLPPSRTDSDDSSTPTSIGGESSTDPTSAPSVTDPTVSSDPTTSASSEEPTTTTSEVIETTVPPMTGLYPNPSDPMEEGPFPVAVEFPGDGQHVSLLVGGDVLMHSYLINGGLQADGSYDYNYAFEHLKSLTAAVDFAYLNMEGTLAGAPYSGFPLFSAPDQLAEAIAGSGFDMAKTSNNHAIDKGTAGLDRTISVLRDQGLIVSGSRQSMDEPFYQLTDIGGIRIAFATFTYETIRQGGQRALNALIIPEDMTGRINSFSMEEPYMSADFARMGRLAKTMREAGADFVVFNIHWGTEYSSDENWYQQTLSQILADNGTDLIIGNGPHVIQPIKEISSTTSDHKTLVYYSVGNLLSDQLYGTADSAGRAEDGLLAEIHLERQADGQVRIQSAAYIPTYVYKVKTADTASLNTIIPVRAALADPAAYGVEAAIDLLQASLTRTETVMGNNAVTSVPISGK